MAERLILRRPSAQAALRRGMSQMTGLLRPTLGPLARTVAISRARRDEPPEILDNAATIARRTIQIRDPFENMGAMLVRHLVWKVFERAGDGAATAAVLAQKLMDETTGYLDLGGSPGLVKRGIELALQVSVAQLRGQARSVESADEIAGVVAGTLLERDLAELVGEVMTSVGPDGAVLLEDALGAETTCEYIDGIRWNEGYLSPFLLKEGTGKACLLNPRIFVTDHVIDSVEQLVGVLEACIDAGERSLLVVAPEIRSSALSLLIVNQQKGVFEGIVAVKAPSYGSQRTCILEDIAAITGGRCIRRYAHERVEDVTIHDLGKARQAWATASTFAILGGQGKKTAVRHRINQARSDLDTTTDEYVREKARERIGKLAGAAAVLSVGGSTQGEQEDRKFRIQAALASARAALLEGVVPGGGAALIACLPAVEAMRLSGDEAVGAQFLERVLGEPMRVIAANSGFDGGRVIHEARRRGDGWTFDVVRREWVDSWSAGIVDPLTVTMAAIETSVSAATMAMTIGALVRRKRPVWAAEP